MLEEHRVLHVPEAHRDAGRVRHSVRAHADDVAREHAGGRAQEQLERVFGVEVQAGELRRGVLQRRGDGGEPLPVAVDVERAHFGGREVEHGPFEGNGGLGDVAQLG